MRGRKPIPSRLASLHGLPGKRARNPREPKFDGDLCEAPKWLSVSQKSEWQHVIAHSPSGLLKPIDQALLAVYVVAIDLHRQGVEALSRDGVTAKTPNGFEVQSPYLAIVNRQASIAPGSPPSSGRQDGSI